MRSVWGTAVMENGWDRCKSGWDRYESGCMGMLGRGKRLRPLSKRLRPLMASYFGKRLGPRYESGCLDRWSGKAAETAAIAAETAEAPERGLSY